MEIQGLLKNVEEAGGKIVRRSTSNLPHLVILGECHMLDFNINAKCLFTGLQPDYFLCEGINSNERLDFQKYSSIETDFFREERTGSFEWLVQSAKHDIIKGYMGNAILDWFNESPKTIFVGIELQDKGKRDNSITKAGKDIVESLDNYLVDMLHLYAHKLTDTQYQRYDKSRDWLYSIKEYTNLDAYDTLIMLNKLEKNIPKNVLVKANLKDRISETKEQVNNFNISREKTMANNMVTYALKSNRPIIAVVGANHIRRNSIIFPILDKNSITYFAIDIHDTD